MKVDQPLAQLGAEAIADTIFGPTTEVPASAWETYRTMARAVLEAAGPVFVRRAIRAVDERHDALMLKRDDSISFPDADRAYIDAKEAIRALLRQDATVELDANGAKYSSRTRANEAADEDAEPKRMD